MNHTNILAQPPWCVCDKQPRSLSPIPVDSVNRCVVCGLYRRPRGFTSSSDDEEKLDAERQKMLLQRRRAEEAAQKNKASRFKLPIKGKKPQAMNIGARNNAKSDVLARTPGGGLGEAGDGLPEDAMGKLPPKPNKMGRRHVDSQQEPSAPPPSSPSPPPPPAPSGSPREEVPVFFGRKRSATKKFTPLKGPITDPSGGAISKVYDLWGTPGRSQAPLSSIRHQEKMQGSDLASSKSKPKYTDSQLASQFDPSEEYDGPSEDALVVEEARRMLSRPNSLYMDPRPDLPNNRIGNYGSSFGRFWGAPRTVPPAPASQPAEEIKADTKERCDSSATSSIQADGAEEAGKSEEQPVKPTGKTEYEEMLENLGLMDLSEEKEGTTDLANDNVVSANKAMTDEDYSEVVSRMDREDSEDSIRVGGSLPRRSEENMLTVQEAKSSTYVRNHEEKEPSRRAMTYEEYSQISKDQRSASKESSRVGVSLPRRCNAKMIKVEEPVLEAKSSTSVRNPEGRDPRQSEEWPKGLLRAQRPASKECIKIDRFLPKGSEAKVDPVMKPIFEDKPCTYVSNHKERNPKSKAMTDEYSKVLFKDQISASKESIRIGGCLLKRSEENMIKVKEPILEAKSSIAKCNKCDFNVRKSSEKLEEAVSVKSPTLKYTPSKKEVDPVPLKKRRLEDMPICRQSIAPPKHLLNQQIGIPPVTKKTNLLNRQSLAPPKPLPNRQVGVPPVTKKQATKASRIPVLIRKQKPEARKLVTKNVKTFETAYQISGNLPQPKMASFERQFAGNLSESYVEALSISEFRMPYVDLGDLKGSCRDFEENVSSFEAPISHVPATRNIKTFHSFYLQAGALPIFKMACFDKKLMGILLESYIQNQPVMPLLDLSEVVAQDLEDYSRNSSHQVEDNSSGPKTPLTRYSNTPKEPDRLILETKAIKFGKRPSESKFLICPKCGHDARKCKEGNSGNKSEDRRLDKSESATSTKLKCTASKRRVCQVNSTASGRSPNPGMIKMEKAEYTWEDLLLVSTNIASSASPVLVTGNMKALENFYYVCGVIPIPQNAFFVLQLAGKLSKSYIRNQPAKSIFEFRMPDVDPDEVEIEHKAAVSKPKSPIPHAASPERPVRSNLQAKKKARPVWPDWGMGEASEGFLRQRKSLIQKEVVTTTTIYDPDSAQSESLEERPLRRRKSRKIMKEKMVKRYDQVDELEIMHKISSNKPAPEPELCSETSEDSGTQGTKSELYEFRISMPTTESDAVSKEISLEKNKPSTCNIKADTKESEAVKQNPEIFSEIFATDSEPILSHRSTVYPCLPALKWHLVSLEKAEEKGEARLSIPSGIGKECSCPIYKCKDSLTPQTLASHFIRDHRNKSEENYHQVVEGLPTPFSFNCKNMSNGNTFVTLLLYSSIRRDTSSPVRYYPLVLLAAPNRIKNGLSGIFFWVVGYPTEAKLAIKLSVKGLKGLTRIIRPRHITKKQNPLRFSPDSKDHLFFEVLSSEKPGCVRMCVVIEGDVNNFRA